MGAKQILLGAAILGGIVGYARSSSAPAVDPSPQEQPVVEQSIHYSGCNEVRAAGKAPIYAGEPGYSSDMDGDDDGIACEPIRGSQTF